MDELPRERTDHILKLWAGAAPEREVQLKEIMVRVKPAFIEARDKPEMLFEAGATMIMFNQRTLDAKWILAHAAWQAIEAYSGVLACLSFFRRPLRGAKIAALPGQRLFNAKYKELSAKANELLAVHDLAAFQWPQGIHQPDDEPKSAKQKATHDLLLMAIGFTFLHELRHAMLRSDDKPYAHHAEEHECDRFAAEILLGQIPTFVASTKWTVEQVMFKRATAMALAIFIVAIVTPEWARKGTVNHPPIGDRLRRTCLSVDLPPNNRYWICMASFVLALLEMEGRAPKRVDFRGRKDLAVKLAEIL